MPTVDVTVDPVSAEIELPDACTVGQWKKLLGEGFLGDKILYSARLSCRTSEKGSASLADDDAVPSKMYMEGPRSVLKMLELALNKQQGRRIVSSQLPSPPSSAEPRSVVPASPQKPAAAKSYAYMAGKRSPPQQMPTPQSQQPQPALSGPAVSWPSGRGKLFSFYTAGQQGMRPYMEDRAYGGLELPGLPHAALFGIFDGHGGQQVSTLAVERLPGIIAKRLVQSKTPREALALSFQEFDQDIQPGSTAQNFLRVGSTAVVVLVLQEGARLRLLCANCGDSRAVLCRRTRAVDLSKDQKPNDPAERSRIEAAGGRVELHGPCWRIDSGLNLSRAFGDFLYKANRNLASDQQKVICHPEIKDETVESGDEFLVLASDGVFEVFSSQQLVTELQAARKNASTWPQALDIVLRRAIPGGDNVSLCLVELHSTAVMPDVTGAS
eukprot:TRINITY_DN93498_c0_g1_i1.p1 TRINITY_DN93498_c0_g1~~TRINITY_DN93498_c0_g1_i1.p1  ORF type:complete len:440 (-),score=92.21 TRINITY_DN93498_c0_g1_i1:32-1351(-)